MTSLTPARLLFLAALPVGVAWGAEARTNLLLLDGDVTGTAIVAVGDRGTILRSTDHGRTWDPAPAPATATLTGVSFAAGSPHGWAVGHDSLILASADGGLTWRQQWQAENLQDSFLDVLALDAQHVIALGAYGLFVTTDDGGRTWTRRKIAEDDYHLNRITRGPGGTLYVAGEHGTLLRSSDRGATWDRIDSPYNGSFYGILPLDAHTLVAYGLRGRIYRSADDGASWVIVPSELRGLFATAARAKNGALVFAGQSRAFLVSRDGGATVTPWSVAFTAGIAELLALPDGTLLALGENGASILPEP